MKFQEKAWCDEQQMENWCRHMWKRPFSVDACHPKLLIADVYKAQTTQNIKDILSRRTHTSLVLVPPGCTSLVQPFDVAFNQEFKAIIERQQNSHMQQNLEKYVNSIITAGQQRLLVTKWVGAAWTEMSQGGRTRSAFM